MNAVMHNYNWLKWGKEGEGVKKWKVMGWMIKEQERGEFVLPIR